MTTTDAGFEPVLTHRVILDHRAPGSRPDLTVMVAVYDVERYLPAMLESLERQKCPAGRVEYIFVSDQSPDHSSSVIERWARRRNDTALLEAAENGGPARARNIALSRARGAWVTAIDPDDVVSPTYVTEVLRMIDCGPARLAMLTTRVYPTADSTGRFTDTHPLGRKLRFGNRFVSLREHPECISLGATTVIRRSVLIDEDLWYDERCTPTFEDGNLIGRYLAHCDDPVVGVVATAHYFYRKRDSGDSAVQGAFTRPERYTNVLRYGYLSLLDECQQALGRVPTWAANMVLYDLGWYLREAVKMDGVVNWIAGDLRTEFLGLLPGIVERIEPRDIEGFYLNPVLWRAKQALLSYGAHVVAHARFYVWESTDHGIKAAVLSTPGVEVEAFHNGRLVNEDEFAGVREIRLFGELFLIETTINVGPGDLAVLADGIPLRRARVVRSAWPKDALEPAFQTETARARAAVGSRGLTGRQERLYVEELITRRRGTQVMVQHLAASARRRASGRLRASRSATSEERNVGEAQRLAMNQEFLAKNRGVWIFLDHRDRADDNAEHLYRYLRAEHPEQRAVFLLDRDSQDWRRLEQDGFELIEYGSPEAWAMTLVASVVASSDAVEECQYPAPRSLFKDQKHKFVFLQHGVLEKDLSLWMNLKHFDLVVSSLKAEYDAFTTVRSPYNLLRDDVALTGLPRFDRLRSLRSARLELDRGEGPATLLVMPTWRRYLRDTLSACESSDERRAALRATPYGRQWVQFLESPVLRGLVDNGSLRVRFLAHPNMQAYRDAFSFGEHVEVVDITEVRFQEALAGADMFVTDFSSLVFDAAFLGLAVAYFQFDDAMVGAGGHSWRPGYFDYEAMGVGPVFTDSDALVRWTEQESTNGAGVPGLYEDRRRAMFWFDDGKCSERVYEAILKLV